MSDLIDSHSYQLDKQNNEKYDEDRIIGCF